MNNYLEDNGENAATEITQQLTEEESTQLLRGMEYLNGLEYMVSGSLSTVVGTRKNQQDSCYVSVEPDGSALGIVCDGMGGLEGGEMASRTALQTFVEDFEAVRYGQKDYYNFFCEEVIKIDEIVAGLTNAQGETMSAGTTLVAVSVVDGYMQFISVGDSKIYVLRNGQLRTMNREHNYYLILDEQYRRGEITQGDYLREGARGEALISYLGMGNISIMDANPIPISLIDGDIIILCSDGLYKSLSEEQIAAIIRKNPINLEKTLQELQEEARVSSPTAQDNTSIVLLSYRRK